MVFSIFADLNESCFFVCTNFNQHFHFAFLTIAAVQSILLSRSRKSFRFARLAETKEPARSPISSVNIVVLITVTLQRRTYRKVLGRLRPLVASHCQYRAVDKHLG